MALCFVTQIVENNYSVCRQHIKLRSLKYIIFQPSTRSRHWWGRGHVYGGPRSKEGRNSMVRGHVPLSVNEVEKGGVDAH
jgi:hypothetical protein